MSTDEEVPTAELVDIKATSGGSKGFLKGGPLGTKLDPEAQLLPSARRAATPRPFPGAGAEFTSL